MIRKMKIEDVDAVATIEKECFSIPWSKESIEKELTNKDSFFCVCEIDGKTVGYAGIYLAYPEGEITNIAITKKHREHGYAGQLLEFMFENTGKLGITDYTLEVRVSNEAAIKLYEKYGFVSEGIRKNFYDMPKEDANIMWKRK